MILRLEKEQQKSARRQLYNDIVYVISHEALKEMQRDGKTELSPVEVYLSSQRFCETLLSLPDVEECIDDEIDELFDEAQGENDAMLILTISTVMLQAISKKRVGLDIRKTISRIYEYLDDNENFLPFFKQLAYKEESRWIEGKKTELLNYEMQEIEFEGGGSEEVRRLFEDFINYGDKIDVDSIKGNLLILNRYNIEHNHVYDNEILSLYDKLGIKSTPSMNINEYVAVKQVDTEIHKVESGGTGVVKEFHK